MPASVARQRLSGPRLSRCTRNRLPQVRTQRGKLAMKAAPMTHPPAGSTAAPPLPAIPWSPTSTTPAPTTRPQSQCLEES
jgi:hypothetical protein